MISQMKEDKRSGMNRLLLLLLYAGLSREAFEWVRPEIDRSNRDNLMFFASLSAVMIGVMFALSFRLEEAVDFRWLYLTSTAGSLFFAASAFWLVPKKPALLDGLVLAFVLMILSFGLSLGLFCGPNQQSVTFIVLILTVPLLFNEKPVYLIAEMALCVTVFVAGVVRIKEHSVVVLDVVNTVVFSIVSAIVSTHMMSIKLKRFLYEQEVLRLSETDLLTGLRNRNAYEKQLPAYPRLCKSSLGCVFVDANGLHELNNAKGHAAGDALLCFVAEELLRRFDRQHVYRIGGDEYVAFAPDCEQDALLRLVSEVAAAAELRGYHISTGIQRQTAGSICMDELIRSAEKRMYANKAAYYARTGGERASRSIRS